ncbi:MAG: hypothetical protein S4CHLAM45_05680 [Chlamydiales bacterium]|nr:hypothetical protein [Chlamydiales bacterium]MCH9619891.1 hypothetical protein [Chlamydiales bacterium]MCH9622682.1 hypothetical protein [Chlamydiales bacterium]
MFVMRNSDIESSRSSQTEDSFQAYERMQSEIACCSSIALAIILIGAVAMLICGALAMHGHLHLPVITKYVFLGLGGGIVGGTVLATCQNCIEDELEYRSFNAS